MSTTYAGDETNFPASITIPSDGDTKPAASVNVALEGLADRTAYLLDRDPAVAFHADPGLAFASTSATLVDVTGLTTTIGDCKVGDKLLMTLVAGCSIGTAGFEGTLALTVNDGSDHVMILALVSQLVAAGSPTPTVLSYVFTVTAAVNHEVKAQARNDGTHAISVSVPATIMVLKVRPQ